MKTESMLRQPRPPTTNSVPIEDARRTACVERRRDGGGVRTATRGSMGAWLPAAVLAIAIATSELASGGGGGGGGSITVPGGTCQSLSPARCPAGVCASVLTAALRQCSATGGGVVRLAGGTYHLSDSDISSGAPMIALSGLANVYHMWRSSYLGVMGSAW